MEEFAQTREQASLFDDDFTPIVTELKPQTVASQSHHSQRGQHKYPPSAPKQAAIATESDEAPTIANLDQTPKPPAAVRGDRSATGGINKPKLTEAELSARLEAAKLNNARREEAHRLAEEDEASFQRREAQAGQKRKEEGVARRAMEGEREKNRLRKLGARAGREWDEGKEDQHVNPQEGSQYRRGAHGGVAYRGGRQQDEHGEYASRDRDYPARENLGQRGARGRGDRNRGERGRGGRGGRGREGRGYDGGMTSPKDHSSSRNPTAPDLGAEIEFPALPTTTAKPTDPKSGSPAPSSPKQQDNTTTALAAPSPVAAEDQSWADQMANEGVRW
ncbi:hypothetical protein MMC07_000183 [Pseudocyphellaria aurata]|nr:hypothetical protein [Pseudocyphellaria aurata]